MEAAIRRGAQVIGRRYTTAAASTSIGSLRYSTVPASSRFTIVEVGPRDGLQNEKTIVATGDKVALIEKLVGCGLKNVEATSFVSPKWVPQMGDNSQVMQQLSRKNGVHYPVLVPNIEGLKNALAVGVTDIAIFAAASEQFSKKNVNCTIEESLKRFEKVTNEGVKLGLNIRGYVSCVLGCPYEGKIPSSNVIKVTTRLLEMGCSEISLGDTIGVGTPGSMSRLLDDLLTTVPVEKIAVHCHDTYGQALANVLAAIEKGVRTADSSVAGLGGCPYARGASGNLATEDLVYMLNGLGFNTGVDLDKLLEVSAWVSQLLNREVGSKVGRALLCKKA
uniref:hydroxymethylglutaryl-CoA lyase n=1 Tax=Plectus sambesii TaxID=2011161 RepID=A0A914V7M0_9BILA